MFAAYRVVNLASLWAGPLAAHVLTRLGADVVSVESTGRPGRGAPDTPQWFDPMNSGQRSSGVRPAPEVGVSALAALLRRPTS